MEYMENFTREKNKFVFELYRVMNLKNKFQNTKYK